MRFIAILTTLIAAVLALPHGDHDGNRNKHGQMDQSANSSNPSKSATAVSPSSTVRATTAAALSTTAKATATPAATSTGSSIGQIDPSLVLDFGLQAGLQPDGTGNCKAGTKNIPCSCPPSRDAFIARLQQYVDAGHAFDVKTPFPTGTSSQDALTRVDTMIVTLQNFNGDIAGHGCPAISAPNFSATQQKLIASGA